MRRLEMWRLIRYDSFDAATNMAIDEAILESHIKGQSKPTLRFYGFQPEAISLGYAQKLNPELEQRLRKSKFSIVRRPTGGRAVLHSGDLTYSFVASTNASANPNNSAGDLHLDVDTTNDAVLNTSVSRAYKQISQGLINGLSHLGLATNLGASEVNYRDVHDCFLAATGADLQANGMKLVGSAQLRRHQGVLQHGSILLNQEQETMGKLFSPEVVLSAQPISNVESIPVKLKHHANLFELIGIRSIEELEEAFTSGFSSAFDATFEDGSLTEDEWSFANEARAKYLLE